MQPDDLAGLMQRLAPQAGAGSAEPGSVTYVSQRKGTRIFERQDKATP